MKRIIKLYLQLTIFALLIILGIPNIVFANDDISEDATKSSSWKQSNVIKQDVYGMNHELATGNVTTGKKTSPELVNYYSMKTDGVSSKLVTWAMQFSKIGYATTTLSSLAKDYEKNHPGWLVVGGINADQWYYQTNIENEKGGYYWFNNQPYYSMKMDYENRFVISPFGTTGSTIGFKNNGASNGLVKETGRKDDLILKVYDSETNKFLQSYPVQGVNQTPGANETSVWSTYINESTLEYDNKQVSSSNGLFIVDKAMLSYMNNSREYTSSYYNNVDSFFGKGVISSVASSTTLNQFKFAIDTNNQEVKNYLKEGQLVVIEHQFSNSLMDECESASGYHTAHMINGLDQTTSASYNTSQYSRSMFGQKEDGTYFLMTVSNSKKGDTPYYGTNFTETNAILHHYEAYDAFQDDGGGSVTAIVRNNYGDFDVVNESSDSAAQRNIFSGLFFVVRDPGITCLQKDATYYSISLSKTDKEYISNVKVELNGTEYLFDDSTLKIGDLAQNTEYVLKVSYDVEKIMDEGSIKKKNYIIYRIKTRKYDYPTDIINVVENTSKDIVFKKQDDYLDTKLKDICIYINDDKYVVDELPYKIETTKYTSLSIQYSYVIIDDESGMEYDYISPVTEFQKGDYVRPSIFNFSISNQTKKKITISYDVRDLNKKVSHAYILLINPDGSNSKMEISLSDIYNKNVFELNVTESKYPFTLQLVLEYEINKETFNVQSEVVQILEPSGCGCKKTISMNNIYIVFSFLLVFLIVKKKNQ